MPVQPLMMDKHSPGEGHHKLHGHFHGNGSEDSHVNHSNGDRLDSGVFDEPFGSPDQKDVNNFHDVGELGTADSIPIIREEEKKRELSNSPKLGHESETRSKCDVTRYNDELINDLKQEGSSRVLKNETGTEDRDGISRDSSEGNAQKSSLSGVTKDWNKSVRTEQSIKAAQSKLGHSGSDSHVFKDKDDKEAQFSASAPSSVGRAKRHRARKSQLGIFRPRSKSWSSYGAVESSSSTEQSPRSDVPAEGTDGGESGDAPEFSFRRISTRHKFTLLSIAFVNFGASAAFALLAPFFPQEASLKGVGQGVIGMIFGIYELLIFLSSPIMGSLITRIGAKFMFVSGVLVSGACGVMFGTLGMSPPGTIYIVMCFLTRSVEAIGSSAVLVASFAIIAHEFPANVATVFGALETFSGFGMMVGPPLGGALYQAGGFGLPFYTLGGVLIACGIICVWLLPAQNHSEVPFEGSLISFFLKPSAFVVTVSIVVGAFGLGSLDPSLAKHFAEFNLSPFWIGVMFFLAPAVYAVTAPVFGWIGDNKGYTITMIVGGNILTAIAFVLIGPAPFLNIKLQLWLEIVSLILLGLFLGCALIPTFKALLDSASANGYPETFATYGIVSGLFNSAFSFGSFLGPTTLGGIVNDTLGFAWTACICALCYIFAGLLVLLQVCVQRYYDQVKNEKGRTDERSSLLQTQFSPTDMTAPQNYQCV